MQPRFQRHLLALCITAASVASAPSAMAAAPGERSEHPMAPVSETTDRLIVKYKDGTSVSQKMAGAQERGHRRGVQMSHVRQNGQGGQVFKMDRKLSVADARALAQDIAASDADVEYAEPDRRMYLMVTPNDSYYANQWHYSEATAGINAPAAWDKSTGTGIVVAVIDTGYRPHADLVANILPGYDFISTTSVANDGGGRDNDAQDPGDWVAANECGYTHAAQNSSWHGTHVAGTIAAVTNNSSGVAGVAYGAKVLPARVLGKCGGYTSDIADAIIWTSGGTVAGVPANTTPARVVSLSLGGSGTCDVTTQNAINSARSRGTVVVVAAGNSNADAAGFSPASCNGVVTVAAVNRTGGRAWYSNYGAKVDLAAPGGDTSTGAANGILSTLNTGTSTPGADAYAWYQGTSMATPHVSAIAALMLARNPALTADQVESLLKSTTRAFPATCSQCGTGIVNASAAIDAAITAPAVVNVTEVETNNTLAAAQVISSNRVKISGNLSSKTDTDYYKFTVATGASLSALLSTTSTNNYNLYLYNAAGTQLAASTQAAGVVDGVTSTNTGAATTWYLRVVYKTGGTGSTSGAYTLQVN